MGYAAYSYTLLGIVFEPVWWDDPVAQGLVSNAYTLHNKQTTQMAPELLLLLGIPLHGVLAGDFFRQW